MLTHRWNQCADDWCQGRTVVEMFYLGSEIYDNNHICPAVQVISNNEPYRIEDDQKPYGCQPRYTEKSVRS